MITVLFHARNQTYSEWSEIEILENFAGTLFCRTRGYSHFGEELNSEEWRAPKIISLAEAYEIIEDWEENQIDVYSA